MAATKLIVITGPESSGKTFLAELLAARFKLPLITEFARTYLTEINRAYESTDLLTIAQGQYREFDQLSESNKTVLMDTDALTIRIWSQEKYQDCHPEIEKLLRRYPPDHYLLCAPDIQWSKDPLRENPTDRDRLFSIYKNQILETGVPFDIISGNYQERAHLAVELMEKILSFHS